MGMNYKQPCYEVCCGKCRARETVIVDEKVLEPLSGVRVPGAALPAGIISPGGWPLVEEAALPLGWCKIMVVKKAAAGFSEHPKHEVLCGSCANKVAADVGLGTPS